jgi:DNA-binding NtrC family response regulator
MVIRLLAVLPRAQDRLALEEIVRHPRWHLQMVQTLNGSRVVLKELFQAVVICDTELPDGNWRDVLDELAPKALPMPLIVASRLADDRLWAEVLNLGGYDVLAKPFQRDEVIRSVSLAYRQEQDRWQSMLAAR